MRFGPVIAMSLLIFGSQAMPINQRTSLRVPPGQPEGTYVVHNWGKPNENHERIPDVAEGIRQDSVAQKDNISPNEDAPSAPFERGDPKYISWGSVDLNHNDRDNATRHLQAQVRQKVPLNTGDCVYVDRGGNVLLMVCR